MTKLEQAAASKNELIRIAETLTIPALTEACRVVLYDPRFVKSYGGTKHHNYEGGLANHTLEVLQYALEMTKMFPHADRNVVITATIFHDYMKVRDYTASVNGLQTTIYRQLVRHVAGSHAEFMKAVAGKDVHEDVVLKIEHAMLAHHGRLEWQSPVEPQLVEAYTLHFADMYSANFGDTRR